MPSITISRVLLAASLVVSIVLGVVLSLESGQAPSPPSSPESTTGAAGDASPARVSSLELDPPRAGPTPPPARSPAASPRGDAPWQPAKALSQLSSGRAFVHEALRHPRQGGAFHAKFLLDACSTWRQRDADEGSAARLQGIANDGAAHALLQRARARHEQACGSFSDAELADPVTSLIAPNGMPDDPMLVDSALLIGLQPESPERRAAAQRAIASADPLLLEAKGAMAFRLLASGGWEFWLDGQRHSFSDQSVRTALHLLPCELGLDCGIDHDLQLAWACMQLGHCFESRAAVADWAGAQEGWSARDAKRLAADLASVLRQGQLDRLAPPPGR